MTAAQRHALLPVAAVVLLLAVLQALPVPWQHALRYERAAVLQGELWRVWTGHLVHLGWWHLALNAAGLACWAALADRPPPLRTLLGQGALLAAGISALFLLLMPALAHYVGLSGVLYGLFVLGLWPGVLRLDPVRIAALSTIGAWLASQLIQGPDQREMALIGGTIIVQAHVFGVVCAAALLLARARRHGGHTAPGAAGPLGTGR